MEEEDDPRKRRRSPLDPFDDLFEQFGLDRGDFDRMFNDLHRSMMDAMRSGTGVEPGKPFVHGFSFKLGPDGRPTIEHFGNRPKRAVPGGLKVSEEREPLTDVIVGDTDVAVTVEMPGVAKEDISLDATPDRLEISVDTEARKYHKIVNLPTKVDPASTKATYNNGILDVTLQRVGHDESRVKVNID